MFGFLPCWLAFFWRALFLGFFAAPASPPLSESADRRALLPVLLAVPGDTSSIGPRPRSLIEAEDFSAPPLRDLPIDLAVPVSAVGRRLPKRNVPGFARVEILEDSRRRPALAVPTNSLQALRPHLYICHAHDHQWLGKSSARPRMRSA